jgi:putative ABC transport system permease protein
MLLLFFKTAFRNLFRNRSFAIINIFGLAVGMAVFLLITQYVRFENSYENFISNRENIYRVAINTYRNNELILASAENYPAAGPALKNALPEVLSYARLYNLGYKNNVIITNENAKPEPIALKQRRFLYADAAFLSMMNYEIVKGNAQTALADPYTAVISEKYAQMYFGKEDPIGRTLHMHDDDSNDELVKVTAVFKEIPANTHLKFDILFSYKTLFGRYKNKGNARYDQSWTRQDMYTFVQLKPGTDPKFMESRFPGIINKYKPLLKEANEKQTLVLQPLKDIHLYSDLADEPESNGNAKVVLFISLIGIFVLIIAWINYINLSTAKAIGRAKEVGIRKVAGAFKYQLIIQFITEAAMVNLIALIIGAGMVFLVLPYFNKVSGLELNSTYLLQPWYFALLAGLWIVGSLLSGFYPSWVLSSYKPVVVLKGKLKSSVGGILLRKGLVVTQFMASIALIAGTLIVYRQLHYMMSQDLGMNINQVLVMDRPGNAPNDFKNRKAYMAEIDLFRDELKKSPAIEAVTSSATIPGKQREYKATIKRNGDHSNDSIIARINSMDYDFFKVFKMKLIAGRNFSREFPKDPDTSVIITSSAVHLLGFKTPEEAIGKTLVITEFDGAKVIVAGVVNDYHQVSLKKPLEPTLFLCALYDGEYYSIRLHTNNLPQALQHIQQSWATAFPGNPFDYFFLDDYFNRQYASERKFEQLFIIFAALAILISCLGLFGLSAFTASQRIREIGIRKVLGASVVNIATMLSGDFFKLVLLSILLVSPLTWFIMNSWLRDFSYRIHINWWIFALAGLVSLLIALITVSFQAIRAARANPVNSLRSE